MNTLRRFRVAPFHIAFSCIAAAIAMAGNSRAQEAKSPDAKPAAKTDEGRAQLLQAYELSKTASAEKDFSQMIELCEQGMAATSSASFKAYGKKLAAFAHYKRGDARASAAQPKEKEVLADFEAAVAYLTDTPEGERPDWQYQLLHHRGVSYASAGQFDKALADFNQVLKLKPDYAKDYFNRAEIYYAKKMLKEAVADYDLAMRYGYGESVVYTRRGTAYFKLADTRRAMIDYNVAISRNTQDHEAFTFRGDAYAAEGNYAQAVRDYQRALTLNDKSGRAHFSAGWLRATCPDPTYRDASAALKSAQKAIELDGEDHRYLECLAAAQARGGQFAEAVAAQKKAIAAIAKEEKEALQTAESRLALYEKKQPLASEEPAGVTRSFP